MNKKIKAAIAALTSGHYTFDPKNTEWKHGKKIMDEEEILIYLIQFAKSQNIADAGVFGDNALQSAKQAPEITVGTFVKRGIVRNRERRSAGKYLFAAWCKSVGIKIAGSLEEFMQKNSLLVKRFYDTISVCTTGFKNNRREIVFKRIFWIVPAG